MLVALATTSLPALASARDTSVNVKSARCHCDRYSNPHYSRYVPRTGAYRGGRSYR